MPEVVPFKKKSEIKFEQNQESSREPTMPCRMCGGLEFWTGQGKIWICMVCAKHLGDAPSREITWESMSVDKKDEAR